MAPSRVQVAARLKVIGIAAAAFVLLAVRFSPNWFAFQRDYREAVAAAPTSQHRVAVERALLEGFAERGYFVLQQARDLRTEIDAPVHKIIRWRLLIPAIANVLRLPAEIVLGAAHIGAFALVVVLAALGWRASRDAENAVVQAFAVAIIGGAAAPFFTSMGWLGYYDSWLALALIAVAMASSSWIVLAACVLAPWIDERFVLGLPLALLVRWNSIEDSRPPLALWFRREALLPVIATLGYAIVRLELGGTGGSQTVADYSKTFLQRYDIPWMQRMRGAWEGVRFGWLLVIAAIIYGGRGAADTRQRRAGRVVAVAVVAATAFVGLLTALDLSRSMVLLTPAVAWGAIAVGRFTCWQNRLLPLLVAVAALSLPARQIVAVTIAPVENLFSTRSLAIARNSLAEMYVGGKAVPKDAAMAARWYRKAAALGYPWAQANLGVVYMAGDGMPKDGVQAAEWFQLAAAQGSVKALNNLGVLYSRGDGIPQDLIVSYSWFLLGAEHGDALARKNLENLQPFLTTDQQSRAEWIARDFVAANPHTRDTTEDEGGRRPR